MEQATVEVGARVPQRALRKAGANVNRAERWLSALGGSTLVALRARRRGAPVRVERSVTINRSPEIVSALLAEPERKQELLGEVELEAAPGNRGTVVRVRLEPRPAEGRTGPGKLAGKDPDQVVRGALRRLKQTVEAGEISTIEGQTSCRRNQGS